MIKPQTGVFHWLCSLWIENVWTAGFIQRFPASADLCYCLNEAHVLTKIATVHCFSAFELLILCNCSVEGTYWSVFIWWIVLTKQFCYLLTSNFDVIYIYIYINTAVTPLSPHLDDCWLLVETWSKPRYINRGHHWLWCHWYITPPCSQAAVLVLINP